MTNNQPAQKSSDARIEQFEQLIEDVNAAIDESRAKIESGRVYDSEHEEIRIKRWRAHGYLLRTKLKIVKAQSLEELDQEVEEAIAAEEQWPAISG